MASGGSAPRYAARITPLRPETVWTLEGGDLIETTGSRRRARPLSSLKTITMVGQPGASRRAAHLIFAGAPPANRVIIPAQSLSTGLTLEDRSTAFDAFVAALGGAAEAAPPRRPAAESVAHALMWTIGLTAAGAVFMVLAGLVSGMAALGIALGARLLFVPILLAATLPWLARRP